MAGTAASNNTKSLRGCARFLLGSVKPWIRDGGRLPLAVAVGIKGIRTGKETWSLYLREICLFSQDFTNDPQRLASQTLCLLMYDLVLGGLRLCLDIPTCRIYNLKMRGCKESHPVSWQTLDMFTKYARNSEIELNKGVYCIQLNN